MSAPISQAVFLSYASQDVESARRIADALRAFGVEVWFDQSELRGGDAWDQKLRRQIKECALFIAIISKNTDARLEGYFRREWKLAIDRTHDMAEERAFLLPVVIDETPDGTSHVPEKFHEVQWTRLHEGEASTVFCERVQNLLAGDSVRDRRILPKAKATTSSAGFDGTVLQPRRRQLTWVWASSFAVVVVIFAVVMVSRKPEMPVVPAKTVTETKATKPSAPRLGEKSLVVLPLENLSPDPENAFFTDGMHSEIIATLSRLSDVTVISRDSALALKRGTAPLAEIAQKVGVANVVTGQVRRAGSSVRIVLELRRASDEALLWTKTYDKELRDIFAIQTDIAEEVARVLQAREAKGAFASAAFSTKDPRAYDLFLRSNTAVQQAYAAATRTADSLVGPIKLAEEAFKLDPEFTTAAGLLSLAHVYSFQWASDAAAKQLYANEAKRWGETASRLMSGGGGDGALAYYYVSVERDNLRGLALAEASVRALPNESRHHNRVGLALSRLGRSTEALGAYRRARVLDPLNWVLWRNETAILAQLRREKEFEENAAQASSMDIAADRVRSAIADGRYMLTGKLPENTDGMTRGQSLTWLPRARRFEEALALTDAALASSGLSETQRFWHLSDRADFLVRLHRNKDALAAGATALEIVEKLRALQDFDPSVRELRMAWGLARAGRADEAIAAGKRHVDALSADNRVQDRWVRETELAKIYAHLGRRRECVELLAKLLRVPSGITVPMLRVDPLWDNVREDAGFKALLADPKNNAPL